MDRMSEVGHAFRALRRRPGVVALAIVALGIGTGLPAAIYSVADGTFRRGLPFEDGRRIMHLERRPHGATGEGWSAAARDYLEWQASQRAFEGLAAFQFTRFTLRNGDGADRLAGARMTANAFGLLRVPAALGRTLVAGDDDPAAEPVVVLGHPVWRDRFGADPGVIGRTVFVDGVAHTVVGVMPDGFRFPTSEDLWVPLVLPPGAAESDGAGEIDVFGRLRPGVSRADAMAEFAVIAARLAERYPATNRNMGVAIKPYTARFMGETATRQAYIMLAAVLLVLLVASVNVANLQLVRAVERLRELAVRTALGASRGRIVSQLFLESGAIALLGGIVGVGVAAAAIRGFDRMFPAHALPFWFELRLDIGVLFFILALSVAAALLAGVLPALKASGRDLLEALNDESRGATGLRVGRLMQGLVVIEIAFSLGLLVVAGLMLLGVRNVRPDRLGMAVEDVATGRITLPASYAPADRLRFWRQLSDALAADPASADVAFATDAPATHADFTRFAVEGRDYPPDARLPGTRRVIASDEFFALLGRQIVRGRGFGPGDGPDAVPAVLVNERFAQVHFAGEDALGRRIRLGDSPDEPWRTIVGVAPDLWMNGLDSSPDANPPGVYLPLAQAPPGSATVLIRTRGGEAAAIGALRAAAFALEREAPVYEANSLVQLIRDNSWFFGMGASILTVAGLAALVLATVGLYGVIAFSVGRRTREFGIRMAFGARPGHILGHVLRRGLPAVAIGMLGGFALAWAIGHGVASLLFGVEPGDLRVFAAVGAALAAVAASAMLIPARRAAAVDPLAALRSE